MQTSLLNEQKRPFKHSTILQNYHELSMYEADLGITQLVIHHLYYQIQAISTLHFVSILVLSQFLVKQMNQLIKFINVTS